MPKPIVIAVFNQKGGIGKTTAAYNIAVTLAQHHGKKVLMVDGDPQASLTSLINANEWVDPGKIKNFYDDCDQQFATNQERTNLAHVFHEMIDPNAPKAPDAGLIKEKIKLLQVHEYKNISYIPGSIRTGQFDFPVALGIEGVGFYRPLPFVFNLVIREVAEAGDYDIVLWDLSPSIGAMNQSVIMTSDYILSPFLADYLSVQGMVNVLSAEGLIQWKEKFTKLSSALPGPKFLGAFPQRVQSRQKPVNGQKKPIAFQAHQKWLVEAYNSLQKAVPGLRKNGLLTDNFVMNRSSGIPEFFSLAHDVQSSGRPIVDVRHPHQHPTSDGKSRALNPGEKKRKNAGLAAFLKLIALSFRNMSPNDLNQLGGNFIQKTGLDSLRNDDGTVIPEAWVTSSTQTEAYYTDEEINLLLTQYLTDPKSVILTPMQGDGSFAKRGQLRQNILDRIGQLEQAGHDFAGTGLYVPINLGQNHWVLVVMEFTGGSSPLICHYFDPLGSAMPDTVKDELSAVCAQKSLNLAIHNYGQPLQKDDFNCGPWIVEFARAFAPGNHQFPPANINDSRKQHKQVLKQLKQGNATPGSRRSKRKHQGGHSASVASSSLFSPPGSTGLSGPAGKRRKQSGGNQRSQGGHLPSASS